MISPEALNPDDNIPAMTPLESHERRITAVEARLAEVEVSHGESIYKLQREVVQNNLRWRKLFSLMNTTDVTSDEVDDELDQL